MKITILIKHNLNKIYNILEKCKNNRFLSKYSKSIEVYNDKNQIDLFKKSLKNNSEKIFIIDDNGYLPFLFYSKQKDISVAFPNNADGAKLARAHNDSKVCVIAYNNTTKLDEIFKSYLTTKFEGGRHLTRVNIMHNSFEKAIKPIKFNTRSKTYVLLADHAGFKVKEHIKQYLKNLNIPVIDVGTFNCDSTHYSMFAHAAMKHANQCCGAIAVCFTGAGIANTLNKYKGVNACICLNANQAKLARKQYGANALSIAAKYISKADINKTVKAFISTKPSKPIPAISKLGFSFSKAKFNKNKIDKSILIPAELK